MDGTTERKCFFVTLSTARGIISLFLGGPDFFSALMFFMVNEELDAISVLVREEVSEQQMLWIQNYRCPN